MAPAALPWVDRHKPKHLGEVIGNTDQVRKLAEWLRDWDDVILHGKTKTPKENPEDAWKKFKPTPDNINARAALVSGPPGIGKTTTATLVAKCCRKYAVMEYNASDARSKSIIDKMASSLASNHTIKFGSSGSSIERAVIIMDECDGMAGGGDSGGMQALINMIKATKNPIICICNDRGDSQVRNLSQHCYDMKFRRPDQGAVAKRIRSIMESEGKKVDLLALESTVEACGNDIRQVLNQVQFFGAQGTGNGSQKDAQVMLSPFDACSRLLLRKGHDGQPPLRIDQRMDMFYIDPDLMSLMVQENYLKPFEKGPRRGESEEESLEVAAKAAANIACADSMSGNWEVMSSNGIIGTVYPAFLAATDGVPIRATFPAWLMKKGPQGKAERLVRDMHSRTRAVSTCTCRQVSTTSYHDLLHRRLLQPLTFGDVKTCAANLHALGLNREFFTEVAPQIRTPLGLEDGYKKVEARHKHQLLEELKNFQGTVSSSKRKRPQGGGGEGEEDEGKDDDGGGGGGMFKKKMVKKDAAPKKMVAKGKANPERMKLASLGQWRVVDEGADGEGGTTGKKKVGLIMKFIEGHTCAVRRKVTMHELLAPWRDF